MGESMCLIGGGLGDNIGEKFRLMIIAGKHRGSDGFGVWTDEGILKSRDFSKLDRIPEGSIGLFQCRLAMMGSKEYLQPFTNELTLVHNGEIYNSPQIREYLEGRGVSFESDVDSEVILRLIEFLREKGLSYEDIVTRLFSILEGDYAVGFSDGREIYLFRDPLGVRPLYYSPRGFFASEKKVLWAIGEEATPLQPGELVRISRNGISRKRLFSLEKLKGLRVCNPLESIKKVLPHSVKLRSGKRTGVLFSGGLDSSLIAFLASRNSDVILYAAGAEGSPDLEWARKASELLGLPLREYVFNIEDVRDAITKVAYAIEEPNPMNLAIGLPIYFATKLAGEDGVKVLLSGQGADELFGGYQKYIEHPELMETDIMEIGEKNLARDDKIAMLNGVEGRFPYLSLPVVTVALNTPPEMKVGGGKRKLILRKAAVELGLPRELAEREKKAAQYGSHAQKLLEKIAKESGMNLRDYAFHVFKALFGNAL